MCSGVLNLMSINLNVHRSSFVFYFGIHFRLELDHFPVRTKTVDSRTSLNEYVVMTTKDAAVKCVIDSFYTRGFSSLLGIQT